MTNNEVGEVARRILRRKRRSAATNDEPSAAQTLADSLTEIAMGRQSSDNISVVVVDLKSKKKLQKTSSSPSFFLHPPLSSSVNE